MAKNNNEDLIKLKSYLSSVQLHNANKTATYEFDDKSIVTIMNTIAKKSNKSKILELNIKKVVDVVEEGIVTTIDMETQDAFHSFQVYFT